MVEAKGLICALLQAAQCGTRRISERDRWKDVSTHNGSESILENQRGDLHHRDSEHSGLMRTKYSYRFGIPGGEVNGHCTSQ